jgi:hypothetical protein
MRPSKFRLFLLILPCAGAAACAPPGAYPSLAPRPIEKALAETDEERPAPLLPDDAGLPARMAGPVAEARRGEAEFAAALPAAREAAARAGPAESDSWIEAQQALSRLEAARAVTVRALADLDALALREANERTPSPADLERMEAAVHEVQAMADRQQEQLARLQAEVQPI